jgi:DNA-binding beta-propeller fold protein YncE
VKGVLHRLTSRGGPLASGRMQRTRILMWPVVAAAITPGAAFAAPSDPYVVYTANRFADGAVVLRTDPRAGTVSEISSNGPQGNLFAAPFDIAAEADGNLLVADMGTVCTPAQPSCASDGRIIRVDPITGRQSLLAGGAPLVDPAGLAVAPGGDVYVADNYDSDNNGRVIRIDPVSGARSVVTEGGLLDLPFGILVDRDGSLVVSNRVAPGGCTTGLAGRLVRVQPAGGSQQLVSRGPLFRYPLGVALDRAGRIAFANECGDPGLARVVSDVAQSVLSPNTASDLLVTPERLALNPAGDFLVSDWSLGDGDGGIVRVNSATGAQSLVRQGQLFNHPIGIDAVVNRPPRARLALDPPLVAAGAPVRLDASGSRDPEGLRLAYEWDLDGDGTFERGTAGLASTTRVWRRNGLRTPRVRVNDPHGGRAVAQGVVRVDGSTPQITGLRAGSRLLGVGPRRGRRGRAATARRARRAPPRATTIRFRLSERAGVRVTVSRAASRNSSGRVLAKAGRGGLNRLRVRARGLRPGRYRLTFEATDAVGHEATPRSLVLRVARLARFAR